MAERALVPLPRDIPQVGDIYRHYKRGDRYQVVGYNFHANDNWWMVEYIPLYDCPYPKFSRPLHEWSELVEWQGEKVVRFARVEE